MVVLQEESSSGKVRERDEMRMCDSHATPIHMAPFRGRGHFALRALVSQIRFKLSRPGRENGRTGFASRPYHYFPLGTALCSGTGETLPTASQRNDRLVAQGESSRQAA